MAKELGSTERTLNIVLVGVLLVYGIVNIYLVVNAYNKLDANVDILGDIVNNWKTNTITDIQVVSGLAASCPTGYETAFKDRYWPGIDDGCYCRPGTVSETDKTDKNVTCSPFCTGTCSQNAHDIGCEEFTGKSKTLLNFAGTLASVPTQICIKRSTESFSTSGTVSKGSCPSGYNPCGSGDNLYCTKSPASCPISSFTIETNSVCATGYTCIQLSTSLWIKYTTVSATNTLPLAEFRLNEYAMCDIKSEDNITPGRKSFSLLDQTPTTCYDEGNDKWTYATITEADLFTANNINAYVTSLISYPDSTRNMNGYYEGSNTGANYLWKMASRTYVPWKAECRDKVDSFIKKKTFVDKSQSAQLALLVIGIISTLFLSVVLGIMEIQNLRGVDLSCFDGKGEEERTKLKRFKKFVNYGFKFLQVPFQLWAIFLAAGAKNLFASVSADECSSNAEINANIAYLSKNLASTHKSNLTALAILVATLIFDLILAAWEARKKKNAGTTAVTPSSQPAQEINISSARPLTFDQSSNPSSPVKPQQQPQPQGQGQTVTIQLQQQPQQPAPMQFGQPQQQYPQQPAPMQFGQPQQQYPQQQPAPMQFGQPQQQYPQQQPAPMQFGQPQQQYPQQQAPMQFAPQQYPQQQQQYPRY